MCSSHIHRGGGKGRSDRGSVAHVEYPPECLPCSGKTLQRRGAKFGLFHSKQDIERDPIYEKEHVSKATSGVDAHGAALFNSSLNFGLQYKRGDRFWIHIGAQTSAYGNTVPVINLRTFESGILAIDRVCWLPKVQGPDQELWTLGGEIRKLKHSGPKKFSYSSWAICQHLDGRAFTTKSVQIPTKASEITDHRQLSGAELQTLFEKLCISMIEVLQRATPTLLFRHRAVPKACLHCPVLLCPQTRR